MSRFIYAIGTLSLIRSLCNPGRCTQLWYADHASAGGTLSELQNWFDLLCSHGPSFGYHTERTKSFVVVNEWWRSEAVTIFGDLGIQVVTGHRFLGGFLGSRSERDEWHHTIQHCSDTFKLNKCAKCYNNRHFSISLKYVKHKMASCMTFLGCLWFTANVCFP